MKTAVSHLSIETEVLSVPLNHAGGPVRIGSGEVRSVLGESASSMVYKIRTEPRDRAVKVLRPERIQPDIERLLRGARVQSQLRPHPSIVAFYDQGTWLGLHFVETELVVGSSLDRIAQGGPLPLAVCTALGLSAARALAAAHETAGDEKHGAAHGNLKPSNILLSSQGIVKLTDFGAVLAGPVWQAPGRKFVDALRYASPEQLAGEPPGPRGDLFSLAIVISEALTGISLFSSRNVTRLVQDRLRHRTGQLKAYRAAAPRRMWELLEQCLKKDPSARPGDADGFARALEEMHGRISDKAPETVLAAFASSPESAEMVVRRGHGPLRAAAAVAATIAGIYALTQMVANRPEETPPAPLPAQPPIAAPAHPDKKNTRPHDTGRPPRSPTRPRAPAAAQPAQPKKDPEPETAVQKGTADPLETLAQELRQGRYRQALEVYRGLSARAARSPTAILYKMRALLALDDRKGLEEFFAANDLAEKEFCLARAQALYRYGDYGGALKSLERARTSAAVLKDPRDLDRGILYYTALCHTSLYDATPSEALRRRALDQWFDLKFALRNNQEHRYFIEANRYIRRLASTARDRGP